MPDREIFAWAAPSSRRVTTYEVVLTETGALSCNCPGWIYARGDVKVCRHTRERQAQAVKLLADYKAGRPLPARALPPPPIVAAAAKVAEGDLIGVLEL